MCSFQVRFNQKNVDSIAASIIPFISRRSAFCVTKMATNKKN